MWTVRLLDANWWRCRHRSGRNLHLILESILLYAKDCCYYSGDLDNYHVFLSSLQSYSWSRAIRSQEEYWPRTLYLYHDCTAKMAFFWIEATRFACHQYYLIIEIACYSFWQNSILKSIFGPIRKKAIHASVILEYFNEEHFIREVVNSLAKRPMLNSAPNSSISWVTTIFTAPHELITHNESYNCHWFA